MSVVNFEDFRGVSPLINRFGYVQDATVSSTGGTSGKPSLNTTTPGDVGTGLANGAYEGFARQDRSGVKGVRNKFAFVGSDSAEVLASSSIVLASSEEIIDPPAHNGFAFLEVWQGNPALGAYVVGDDLVIAKADGAWDGSYDNFMPLQTLSGAALIGTYRWYDLEWTMSSLDHGTRAFDGSLKFYINKDLVYSASGLQLGYDIPISWVRASEWNVVVTNPHGDCDLMYLLDGTGINTAVLPEDIDVLSTTLHDSGTIHELTSEGGGVYSTTGNARENTFGINSFDDIGTKHILALKHVASGYKDDSGYRRFRTALYRAGQQKFGAMDYPIGVGDYNWMQDILELDPYTDLAWLIADIGVTEIGPFIG